MSHSIVRKKIDTGKIFNCRKFEPFINSIVEVLSFRGVSMSHFYICEIEGVRFLTKLSFYRKSAPELYKGTSKKTVSQIDAEIQILQILRDNIIDKGISPCILELVHEKRCSGITATVNKKKCKDISFGGENTIYESVQQILCLYGDMVQRGIAHDKCAFIVLERCDITLDDYLRKMYNTPTNVAVIKSILFQIIYTLHAITVVYPKFRHHDLHTENVMLKIDFRYKFDPSRPKYMKFIVGGTVYFVPYFGIIAKIIDFGFSQIPEEGVISNATDDLVSMFYRSKNDVLLLFYWINNVLHNSPSPSNGEIIKMLEKLEPARTYVAYQTERIRNIESEIPTYSEMVANNIFADYTKSVSGDIFGTYRSAK
jgi:serine/threonine protein kinase